MIPEMEKVEWQPLDQMQDREILEEICNNQRIIMDALMNLGNNPMVAAFMGPK
jgi:hypothetical protein